MSVPFIRKINISRTLFFKIYFIIEFSAFQHKFMPIFWPLVLCNEYCAKREKAAQQEAEE